MTFSRVAAIDCGTNSIRLLIADIDTSGNLIEHDRRAEVVRLGQGVDRTGEFAPDALGRALLVARQFATVIEASDVQKVRFVATSATRDVRNRDMFFDGVRSALGVDVEVISGDEEARLSFQGSTGAIAQTHSGPFLVTDLGGGSTELVLGTGSVEASVSMNVGSVRMTERYLADDPPTEQEVQAARADIRTQLDDAARVIPFGKTTTLIGLAGSILTVTAHALGLEMYDRKSVHQAQLPVSTVLASCEALLTAPRVQRAAMGFLHPGRADVIPAGALVWSEVLKRVVTDVEAAGGSLTHTVTSEHDILDGIARSMA